MTADCIECGEHVIDDPEGSPGVFVHDRTLGDRAFDLDEDHVALPEES